MTTHSSSGDEIVLTGKRAFGWMFASAASVVAGIAGPLGLSGLLVASGGGGWVSFGLGSGLTVVAVAALILGRRAKPPTAGRAKVMALPAPSADDYSGLPAPPLFADRAPLFFFSAAGIVALTLFPFGLVVAGVGGCLGSNAFVVLGFAIAAIGPVILAATWVFRR